MAGRGHDRVADVGVHHRSRGLALERRPAREQGVRHAAQHLLVATAVERPSSVIGSGVTYRAVARTSCSKRSSDRRSPAPSGRITRRTFGACSRPDAILYVCHHRLVNGYLNRVWATKATMRMGTGCAWCRLLIAWREARALLLDDTFPADPFTR
jgi:hypothetical protein